MHGDYRVVDADGHVIEPADLWEKYIDRGVPRPGATLLRRDERRRARPPDARRPGWKEASSSIATRRTGGSALRVRGGARLRRRQPDPGDGRGRHRHGRAVSLARPLRRLGRRHPAEARGSHLPRLQPLAGRVLQLRATATVRRGDGLAARRRGRGARGGLRRRGARHEGDLHPAEPGERQDHRPPRLRRVLRRGRAPERADRDARGRRRAPRSNTGASATTSSSRST